MKKLLLAPVVLMGTANMAFANVCGVGPNQPTNCASVPEISALQGTAAIAALAAVVLLAWERSRRAA